MATKQSTEHLQPSTATVPELAAFIARETKCGAKTANEVAWDIVRHYVLRADKFDAPLQNAVLRRQWDSRFQVADAH